MEKHYLTLDEIHALLIEMLALIDRICKAEGIPYFLSGGTLLGAIRHRGFIPWDDDIDLMLPRAALERFLIVAPRYMDDRYELAFPGRTSDYAAPWARIFDRHTVADDTGVVRAHAGSLFIDLFPIDGMPASRWQSQFFFWNVRAHDILLKCSRKKAFLPGERLQWLKKPLIKLVSLLPPERYALRLYRAAGRIPLEAASAAGVCVVTHYGSRERMPASVFKGAVNVSFCGGEYPAPVGWDIYLRRLYGDYMQLPPEEKRASLHRLKIRLLDSGNPQ